MRTRYITSTLQLEASTALTHDWLRGPLSAGIVQFIPGLGLEGLLLTPMTDGRMIYSA